MTDEMKIQNQQPSALPYLTVGGAAGAAGGYWGLPKIDAVNKFMTTPAKYNSYEEIINEADDKFTKAVEEATGEEKTWMEKAAEARKAGVDAGNKYDSELKTYLESNKAGEVAQLPENHGAIEAYNAKRKELIEKEIENLKQAVKNANGTNNEKAIKALEERIKLAETSLKEQTQAVNEAIESFANKRANELEKFAKFPKTKKSYETFNRMIKRNDAKLAEYINSLKGLSDAQKKTLLEQAKVIINNKLAIAELEHAVIPEFAFAETKENAQRLLNEYSANLSDKNKGLKDNISKYIANPELEVNRTNMKRIIDAEKAKLQKVKDFEKVYSEFVKNATPEEVKKVIKVKGAGKVSKHLVPETIIEVTENSSEAAKKLKTVFDGYTEAEKKSIIKLVGENPTAESLNNAIKNFEANVKNLETATGRLNSLQAEIVKIGGEGAYIKDGKLFDKAGKEVKAKMSIPTNLETKVTIPESNQLAGLRKNLEKVKGAPIEAITPEQLAEQAAKNIDAKAGELLKAEQTAINEARAALPKNADKTVEQLTKEFVEKNGTKEEAVKKAQDAFKDDVKKLFEGKRGGKFWGVVAGTAAAGALLAMAFRPNNKQA